MLGNVCAIFDMDGTLADTSRLTIPAFAHAAKEMSAPPPPDELVMKAIGINGIGFYSMVYPEASADFLQEITKKVEYWEQAMWVELGPSLLFPGVLDLLDALKDLGATLAVASTGSPEHVYGVLTATKIKPYFDTIECNDNDKPAEVRKIIAKYPGFRFFMTGDKPKDADAAKANEIPGIGVGYGFSAPEELTGFDVVAGVPEDILSYIKATVR